MTDFDLKARAREAAAAVFPIRPSWGTRFRQNQQTRQDQLATRVEAAMRDALQAAEKEVRAQASYGDFEGPRALLGAADAIRRMRGDNPSAGD